MKVTIDRKTWLRGEGATKSALLRTEDGKKCCLGFYANSCGLDDESILGEKTLQSLNDKEAKPKLPEVDNCVIALLMSTNDSIGYDINYGKELNARERESRIKELFFRIGVEVEFIN